MLLMIEKGIRARMCRAINRYAKANNKYMTNYYKDIESSYLMCLVANNLYGWVISQKLSVNGFEWVEDQFNKDYIKSMMKTVIRDIFLTLMLHIQKNHLIFIRIFRFYQKERKSKNVISLFATLKTKKTMLFTEEL